MSPKLLTLAYIGDDAIAIQLPGATTKPSEILSSLVSPGPQDLRLAETSVKQ
jgi:hypothetical protein